MRPKTWTTIARCFRSIVYRDCSSSSATTELLRLWGQTATTWCLLRARGGSRFDSRGAALEGGISNMALQLNNLPHHKQILVASSLKRIVNDERSELNKHGWQRRRAASSQEGYRQRCHKGRSIKAATPYLWRTWIDETVNKWKWWFRCNWGTQICR